MDAITYGSLFLILGSTRLSVLTCCISENPGKHGFLSADAETQEELKDYLLYEEDGHIGLFVMLGETIKPLFYGTVTCMEVKAQGGRCVLHDLPPVNSKDIGALFAKSDSVLHRR